MKQWKYGKYIENQSIQKVDIVLQISLQRKLGSLWNFMWWSIYIFHSRYNARMCVYNLFARVCTDLYKKNLFGLYYLMNLNFKFHKDPSFSYGDICKTMVASVWCLIFYVLFFLIWASKFPPSVKIIWNLLEHMETIYQNVRVSVKIWHQF